MHPEEQTKAARLSAVVAGSLDRSDGAGDLARQAFCSRTNFFRLFQALIEESPGAMQRRFRLERAAWQLSRTKLPVTEIALDAQYGSLEAFSRAFGKVFRISPSMYRRMGATHFHLPAPNGYHFCGPGASSTGDSKDMDLFDLFAGSDSWHTTRLLEGARSLTDEQLDRPAEGLPKVFPWERAERNLREILERMVLTKEVWTAALTGGQAPDFNGADQSKRTPAALLARFQKADSEFTEILTGVRNRGAWQDTFVDALCEPAETFSFGGMFAHVITFNSHQLIMALDVMRKLGVNVEGFGDPIEFERSLTAQSAEPAAR